MIVYNWFAFIILRYFIIITYIYLLSSPAFTALQMPASSAKDVLRRPVGIRTLPVNDGEFVLYAEAWVVLLLLVLLQLLYTTATLILPPVSQSAV